MTVANRLRGAFAIYVALLVVLAVFYARAVQRSAKEARALTEVAERVRATTDDLARIDQMSADAEKYLATRDSRYLDKVAGAFREFGTFDARSVQPKVLDSLRISTEAVLAASQETMRRQLVMSERVATRAARAAWIAVSVALILGILLSVLLVRSIVRPLRQLGTGTREVGAGRFDYRLDESSGDEFAVVGREFNSMAERLGELDRLKKDFVAKVSHDLKTPLSSMQETNRALLDDLAGKLSNQQRRLITLNLESGQRLSVMLGKLLDLSRVETGPTPALQMVDVGQIARRSVDLATQAATRRGVRLTLVAQECPLMIRGDAAGITQTLDNLIENAIKFSPTDGEVRVSVAARSSDGEVIVTVADEGPGIPACERDRVFERFYQTDAGRFAPDRGVGLGLTICREIVTAHGGRIWVGGNAPRGSTFHVVLRRSIAAVAAITMVGAVGCATFHGPREEELRIAELTRELTAVRAQLDSATMQADSLSLELRRIKEIDLKPRKPGRPPN